MYDLSICKEHAKAFAAESATPKDIAAAGKQVLVNMYNWTPEESLDSLHYKRFYEKVATVQILRAIIHNLYHLLQKSKLQKNFHLLEKLN